jgi:hypothetical protein
VGACGAAPKNARGSFLSDKLLHGSQSNRTGKKKLPSYSYQISVSSASFLRTPQERDKSKIDLAHAKVPQPTKINSR